MTDQLYKSAMFGEIDNCKGVSSNVLLGQESIAGTGIADILFDEAKFYSQNNIDIKYDFDENECNDIESNFMFDIDNLDNLEEDEIEDLPAINLVLTGN